MPPVERQPVLRRGYQAMRGMYLPVGFDEIFEIQAELERTDQSVIASLPDSQLAQGNRSRPLRQQ